MKKKNAPKKLSLSSETVRTLTPSELSQVVGGTTTAITCTCATKTCTTAIICG